MYLLYIYKLKTEIIKIMNIATCYSWIEHDFFYDIIVHRYSRDLVAIHVIVNLICDRTYLSFSVVRIYPILESSGSVMYSQRCNTVLLQGNRSEILLLYRSTTNYSTLRTMLWSSNNFSLWYVFPLLYGCNSGRLM